MSDLPTVWQPAALSEGTDLIPTSANRAEAGEDYVLMSDGPDGEAGGRDRIEH